MNQFALLNQTNCANILIFLIRKLIYIIFMEQKKENLYSSTQIESAQCPTTKKSIDVTSFMNNNFFELSINTTKLNDLFEKINETFMEQNKKIQRLAKDLTAMSSNLELRIQNQSRKSGQLFSKLDMKNQQNSTTNHCLLMDIHRKAQLRDNQIQRRVESLNSKIGKVEDYLKQDIKNGLFFLKKQIIGSVNTIEEENTNSQQKKLSSSSLNFKIENNKPAKLDFNYLIKYFTQKIEKTKQELDLHFQQFYNKKEAQKKKKAIEESVENAQKRQKIETNGNGKFDGMNSKILYPSNKKGSQTHLTPIKQKENSPAFQMSKIAPKLRHMSYAHTNADENMVQDIQCLIQKFHYFEGILTQQGNIIADIKNKQVVIDQKTNILNRKLDKNSAEIAEVKNSIRRMEGHKLDEKMIQELRNYVKWAIRDIEDRLAKKCSEEELQKQKSRLLQKISILHQNLIQKAQKTQIQQALLFLQTKIKQIILLIAAEQSEARQGAIMKIATKCLSCDKDIQKQVGLDSASKKDDKRKSQAQYIKSMTHRVRQKYKKQINKNMTVGNQTFEDL